MAPVSRMNNDNEEASALLKHLLGNIHEWLPKRMDSIRLLRKIADELDAITSEVNEVKLTGTSAAVVGGILTGAGALATVFTMGAAAPLMIGIGMTAAVGGGVVTGGAELKRNLQSKERLNKVKEILDVDMIKQQEITEQTSRLHDLIFKMLKRSEEQDDINGDEFLRALQLFGELLGDGVKGVQRTTAPRSESQERLSMSQLSRAGIVPVLPLLFRSAARTVSYSTARTFTGVVARWTSPLTRMSVQAGRWSSVALRGTSSAAQIAARGAAAAVTPVFLAIDIYQLVQTSIDIHDGSKSESAKELRKVADGLEEELKEYEKFLVDLKNFRHN